MNRRAFLLTPLALTAGCSRREKRVVLYCAQDQDFAEALLADFTRETGLEVLPKFDTEANKSVGLATELEVEVKRPRCDVHWNNEVIGTIRLARKGVYEAYASPNAAAFPESSRPADRSWQAFAARARVLIVNTNLVTDAERPRSIFELVQPRWKGRVAMAKPMFGTTATQAACLFAALGAEKAREFYAGLQANGLGIVAGNKQAATDVATGRFAVGFTDTDDALIEVRAERPVAMIFPDADGIGTLFIPNTLGVVKGGPNPAGARKLVDFLLRPETETRLAEGGGFQLPLNPQVRAALPGGLLSPTQTKPLAVDFERAADLWNDTQAAMRELFAK